MKIIRFAIVGIPLLALLGSASYVLLYNWMGNHLAESVRSQFLEDRKASGHFPGSYSSTTTILGFIPGPRLGYRTLGHDCFIIFSPLLAGPKRELGCVSGEWRNLE